MTTYKAMIPDPENRKECAEILGVKDISERACEEWHWVVWDPSMSIMGYKALLPHVVFRDRFTVVEHRGDYYLVERI
jgi:hypothetical protein